jgi:hypothetical protein
MTHELGELAGVADVEQEVVVIGREHVAAATDFVEALGSSQDSDDHFVERSAGPEEVTAVEGPAGDLDQGTAVRDVTESSAHAQIRRKIRPQSSSP